MHCRVYAVSCNTCTVCEGWQVICSMRMLQALNPRPSAFCCAPCVPSSAAALRPLPGRRPLPLLLPPVAPAFRCCCGLPLLSPSATTIAPLHVPHCFPPAASDLSSPPCRCSPPAASPSLPAGCCCPVSTFPLLPPCRFLSAAAPLPLPPRCLRSAAADLPLQLSCRCHPSASALSLLARLRCPSVTAPPPPSRCCQSAAVSFLRPPRCRRLAAADLLLPPCSCRPAAASLPRLPPRRFSTSAAPLSPPCC